MPTTAQLILALGTVGEPIAEPLRVQAQLGSQTTGEEAAAGGQEPAEGGGEPKAWAGGMRQNPQGTRPGSDTFVRGPGGAGHRGGDGACGQRPAATRWPGREGLTCGDTEGTSRPGREKLGEPPQTAPPHCGRATHCPPSNASSPNVGKDKSPFFSPPGWAGGQKFSKGVSGERFKEDKTRSDSAAPRPKSLSSERPREAQGAEFRRVGAGGEGAPPAGRVAAPAGLSPQAPGSPSEPSHSGAGATQSGPRAQGGRCGAQGWSQPLSSPPSAQSSSPSQRQPRGAHSPLPPLAKSTGPQGRRGGFRAPPRRGARGGLQAAGPFHRLRLRSPSRPFRPPPCARPSPSPAAPAFCCPTGFAKALPPPPRIPVRRQSV